jgi:hypothetical protein
MSLIIWNRVVHDDRLLATCKQRASYWHSPLLIADWVHLTWAMSAHHRWDPPTHSSLVSSVHWSRSSARPHWLSPWQRGGANTPSAQQCLTPHPSYLFTCLLTYLLTHSVVQDIIWKADCHSACQNMSCFLMEPEGSLPCSHKPAIGPYHEPAESISPHRALSP